MGLVESRECSGGVRVKCLGWDELGGKGGACLSSTEPEMTTSTTVVMTDEEVALPQSFVAALALFYQQDLKPVLRGKLATYFVLSDAFLDGFDLDLSAIPLLALLQSNGSVAALRWFISSHQQKNCKGGEEAMEVHLLNTTFPVDVSMSDSTVRVSATPLAFAIALSRGPAVEYFLGSAFVGILDINTKGDDGSTALSIAAILENSAALSLLLNDERTSLETMEAALKALNGFILHGPPGASTTQQVLSPSRSSNFGGNSDASAPLSPVSLGNLSASSVLLSAAIAAKSGGASTSSRVSSIGPGPGQSVGSPAAHHLNQQAPPLGAAGSGKFLKQASVKATVAKLPAAACAGGGGGGGSEVSPNASSKSISDGEEQEQELPLPSRLFLGSLVAEPPPGPFGGPTPPPPAAIAASALVTSDLTPMLHASAAAAASASASAAGGTGAVGSTSPAETPGGASLLFSELPLFATAYSHPTDASPTRASASVPASDLHSDSRSDGDSAAAPWIEVQRDNSTNSDDTAFSGSVCGSEASSSLSTATTATHYTLGGVGKSSREAPHSYSSSWYRRMATPAKRAKKALFRG